jgi:hypothetical protein
MPRRLAKRMSSCAQARTWLTVPGAASMESDQTVWIESITKRLHQQRGLADPGVAADQQRGAGHETAAADAIKLGHAGEDAGRWRGGSGDGGKFNDATAAAGSLGAGDRRGVALFGERVPGRAAFAAPAPLGIGRATGLADKAGRGGGP